nr:hypothetical protein [Tanacetum cinerariifolium]
MTATLKYRDVLNDAIKLMFFPYSFEDRARIWACTHHGFSELTQIDTFYNGLTEQDHNSLNVAAGGNLLNKTTREALKINENKSKVCFSRNKSNVARVNTNFRDNVSKTDNRIDKLADQISNLVEIVNKQVVAPAKAVEKICVTCGGAHGYYECIATNSNPSSIYAPSRSYNQISSPNRVSHQIPPPVFAPNNSNSLVDALLLMPKFASTIKSLLANKDKNFELAKVPLNENCLAMLLKKLPEKLGDPDRSITRPKGVAEDVFVKVGKFHFPTDFVVVEFKADPRVPLILGRSFLRTGRALIDVYGEEITLRVNDESITFNLNQAMRYSSNYDDTLVNRVDVIDIACEEFIQDVLDFQYNPKSSSPTLVSDDLISESDARKVPIVKSSSPSLTSFGESDFFLEEIKDFLNDDSIPIGIENSVYDPEGDILSANKKQEFVKTDTKKVEKKNDEKTRDMSRIKCYNCKKEGNFAKDCKNTKVKDYEYYKIKMLLEKKDKDEQVLLAKDQAWMESSSDSDQEINANMVFMAQIEKVFSDSEASL